MQRKAVIFFGLLLTLASAAYGAELAGRWRGVFNSAVGPLDVIYTLEPTGSALRGTFEIPDLGKFPIENGEVHGDSVFFSVNIQVADLRQRGVVKNDSLFLVIDDGAGEVPVTLYRIAAP